MSFVLNKIFTKSESKKESKVDVSSQQSFSSFGSSQPRKPELSGYKNSSTTNNTKNTSNGNSWSSNPWKSTNGRK